MTTHLIDLPKDQRIRLDITIAVVICLIGVFIYSCSFHDWKQCRTLQKELITERGDYYVLNCEKIIDENLDVTDGFGIFNIGKIDAITFLSIWFKKTEEKVRPGKKATTNEGDLLYPKFVFVLIYILVFALSAFVQAAQLHLYMICVLLWASPYLLILFIGTRSLLPLSFITFLVTYSLIISKLYGYYFNLFAVLGSFLSFIATMWLIAFMFVASIVAKLSK